MSHHATVTLAATAFSTVAASPLVRGWLHRRRSLDHPNERSSHVVPTPRGGGLACAVGGVAGATVSHLRGHGVGKEWLESSAILGTVGRVDDVANLPAMPRFGVQLATGVLIGSRVGGVAGAAIGAVATPAIVNAFNFMDGINGISGGTALAWGLVIGSDTSLDPATKSQAMVTAGMGLGFLPYNIPRAKMFLGDVGSYLLGAGIAATVVQSALSGGRTNAALASRTLAPLAPYLADTGTTMLWRAVRGESLTVAHDEHAYQRLVQKTGWPHWVVAGFASAAAAVCGLAGRHRGGAVVIAPLVGVYLASPAIADFAGKRLGVDSTVPNGGHK